MKSVHSIEGRAIGVMLMIDSLSTGRPGRRHLEFFHAKHHELTKVPSVTGPWSPINEDGNLPSLLSTLMTLNGHAVY